MQVMADVGCSAILTAYFGSGADFTLELFVGDGDTNVEPTPARGDINTSRTLAKNGHADYTAYSGDCKKALPMADAVISDPAIPQVAFSNAPYRFTFNGPLSNTTATKIFGYRILRGTTLVTQELINPGVGFTPANDGDYLDITPIIQLGTGDPAA